MKIDQALKATGVKWIERVNPYDLRQSLKALRTAIRTREGGLKVVISTATKTLQEQLADKDVPLVQALGVKARFAFLKGRQNYLCLLRKEHFDRQPTFAAREEAGMYGQLHAWAQETRTGDRAELSGLPDGFATWREVNSTADTCTGQKCPHYDRCFVFAMRRQAAEADVVIVNHHLFFADLALRSSSAGDAGAAVLPRYDAVIFDEAHAVPEVATENFGAQLSSFRVAELSRDVVRVPAAPQHARDLAARLLREGSAFWDVSGLSVKAGLLKGLDIELESLRTFLSGGIEFASPPGTPRAKPGTVFFLYGEPQKAWLAWAPKIPLAAEK